MSDAKPPAVDKAWESATFEGLERQQLQAWRDIPFEKKLEWLEEAHRLSLEFQKARQAKGLGTVYPIGSVEK